MTSAPRYRPPSVLRTLMVCALLGVVGVAILALLALDKGLPVERARNAGGL